MYHGALRGEVLHCFGLPDDLRDACLATGEGRAAAQLHVDAYSVGLLLRV